MTCFQILWARVQAAHGGVILVTMAMSGVSLGAVLGTRPEPSCATCTITLDRDAESFWVSVFLSEKWKYHAFGRAPVPSKGGHVGGRTLPSHPVFGWGQA